MDHDIEIEGCLMVPEDADFDEVTNLFLEFVESHGWYYGGGFREIRDGHYVMRRMAHLASRQNNLLPGKTICFLARLLYNRRDCKP